MLPAQAVIGQITVEIDGLRSVAATMRQELMQGLRTQTTLVQDALQPGASVGTAITGDAWVGLQVTYSTAIQGTLDALYNLDLGTQAMADAADLIAKEYGDADGLARARARDVQDMFGAPSTGATPGPSLPAPSLPAPPGEDVR